MGRQIKGLTQGVSTRILEHEPFRNIPAFKAAPGKSSTASLRIRESNNPESFAWTSTRQFLAVKGLSAVLVSLRTSLHARLRSVVGLLDPCRPSSNTNLANHPNRETRVRAPTAFPLLPCCQPPHPTSAHTDQLPIGEVYSCRRAAVLDRQEGERRERDLQTRSQTHTQFSA